MIQITKDEAKYLRAMGVSEGVVRTMKQKSKRGRRQLAAEEKYILDLLADFKSKQNVVLTYGEV